MRETHYLSNSRPYIPVTLTWEAQAVLVENPTGSPVYIHRGGTDQPNRYNADHTVPAAAVSLIPINGMNFAFALADPNASVTQPIIGENYRGVVITFLTADEYVPNFGTIGTNSLSQSDQLGGEQALLVTPGNTQQYGPFDIGGWGGILINMRPDTSSARGYIRVLAHHTTTILSAGEVCRFPIWPGAPILLIVPRTLRYVWIEIAPESYEATNVTGYISTRTTLVEVLETEFVPYVLPSIMYFVDIPPVGGTWNTIMPTYGLLSCEVVIQWTAFGAGQAVAYRIETSTDMAKWRYVKGGNRNVSDPNANITFSANRLEQYIRVTITNNSNPGSNHSGYVAFTAKKIADPSLDVPTQYWDRGGSVQWIGYDATGVAPHGSTQRAIYTVGNSHMAYCESAGVALARNNVAGTAGQWRGTVRWNTNKIFGTIHRGNSAGDVAPAVVGSSIGPLFAAESISLETRDTSTGGSVDYLLGLKVTDYSVAG